MVGLRACEPEATFSLRVKTPPMRDGVGTLGIDKLVLQRCDSYRTTISRRNRMITMTRVGAVKIDRRLSLIAFTHPAGSGSQAAPSVQILMLSPLDATREFL